MLTSLEEEMFRELIEQPRVSSSQSDTGGDPPPDPLPTGFTTYRPIAIPPNAGPQQDNPPSGMASFRALRLAARPSFVSLATTVRTPRFFWWDSSNGAIHTASVQVDTATATAYLSWDTEYSSAIGVLIILTLSQASHYFYYFSGAAGARVATASPNFAEPATLTPQFGGVSISATGISVQFGPTVIPSTWSPIYPSVM